MTQASEPGVGQANQLREEVALGNRLLHHWGLATYLGHVSARIPGADRFIIKGKPQISMDRLQPADLMVMDFDGNVVEASDDYPNPVSSWAMHAEIYRARPDVNSVAHTHQKWCTILGIAGKDVLPLQHANSAVIAVRPWPVYDETYGNITDKYQPKVVARTLADFPAVHLRNHGMIFVGGNVEKAIIGARNGEYQAELTWRSLLVGTPVLLPTVFMRDEMDRDLTPSIWEVRDGVSIDEMTIHAWLDENREAARDRKVRF